MVQPLHDLLKINVIQKAGAVSIADCTCLFVVRKGCDSSKHSDKAFVGQGRARDEKSMRLRRELAKVKRERDLLKEAAAFSARKQK